MEALFVRLSQLDAEAGDAIRVVMFYDTLMRRRVDLPALARASAGLAECVTGIRLFGTGRAIRIGPDGREAPAPDLHAPTGYEPSVHGTSRNGTSRNGPTAHGPTAHGLSGNGSTAHGSMTVPITLDEEEIGAVWLERPGPPGPFDDLLLDRLAIAVAAAVERHGPAFTTMADPALVELVISPDSDEAARARALRLMGFSAGLPVRVAAVRSEIPLDHVGGSICATRPVKAAEVAGVGVILAPAIAADRLPAGVRAGIGTAGCPARSWRQARTALRFASPREPVVHYDGLGALALLAEIPQDLSRDNADVAAIARMAGSPDDLETLDAYCSTGSLRRAADLLHLHHSSVARRLDHIGTTLGIGLTEPAGLVRARLALTAWRLLDD
ncbi:PucR family transcriptional regulator [Streptomyces aureoversilis]|uniref:PucR family transcriptional regulator n=1 Tax=Streptomyces aureoversilis TaxID=67277 RepID=A0ABW0A7Y0_9ACTN